MAIANGRIKTMPKSRNENPFTHGITGMPDPFWAAPGAALYKGDVRECLRALPARSVHCCITSPPYWGLRDYNVNGQIGMEPSVDCETYGKAQCGECFVCTMVSVFREVYRVLRGDGTCWLNLGDKFDGDQLLIPSRVALALNKDGWALKQDIIWHAPDKMPESVTNRCTKSHEHIFLLAKSPDYYYDHVSIQEPSKRPGLMVSQGDKSMSRYSGGTAGNAASEVTHIRNPDTANKRDVWIVPTGSYAGAHFATFNPKLITPCILAGTSEHGCCAECNKPWERVMTKNAANRTDGESIYERDRSYQWSRNGIDSTLDTGPTKRETVGWRKMCGCQTNEVKPSVVLDPFVGSGTMVATAIQLGRAGVGIDLSETYLADHAVPRIMTALAEGTARNSTFALPQGSIPPARKMRS